MTTTTTIVAATAGVPTRESALGAADLKRRPRRYEFVAATVIRPDPDLCFGKLREPVSRCGGRAGGRTDENK